MKRFVQLSIFAALLSLSSSAAQACPETECKSGRIEVERELVVTATSEGKPLSGVIVEVTTESKGETLTAFSGETSTDGSIRIRKVDPGDYWLTISYLGHESLQCIRVAKKPGRNANREFNYEWGAGAPTTKQVAGKLVNSETLTGIAGARLKLRNSAGTSLTAVSGPGGSFDFKEAPPGTYVLQVAAATAKDGTRYIDSTFVITVSPEAKAKQLTVKRRAAPNGGCRNPATDLELDSN